MEKQRPRFTTLKATAWLSDTTGSLLMQFRNNVRRNPITWIEKHPYLSFVYNTRVHRKTGHTPFSLVYGQESKYPIDLLLPKAPGHGIQSYDFIRWLEEQFPEAHMNARETLGCNQEKQKTNTTKTALEKATAMVIEFGCSLPIKPN